MKKLVSCFKFSFEGHFHWKVLFLKCKLVFGRENYIWTSFFDTLVRITFCVCVCASITDFENITAKVANSLLHSSIWRSSYTSVFWSLKKYHLIKFLHFISNRTKDLVWCLLPLQSTSQSKCRFLSFNRSNGNRSRIFLSSSWT